MQKKLAEHHIDSPENSSLLLLCKALSQPKSWIIAHGEHELSPDEIRILQHNLKQLLDGEPLPYVLGSWDFYGRSFNVTPDVLIPRPETELLVEKAIGHARKRTQPRIVDVGTGSGAIAVSLAAELPNARVVALDISRPALKIAQQNALRHHQVNISFIQSNLLEPCHAPFDLICANLPYIPSQALQSLTVARHEPRLALDGGPGGLDMIRALLQQAQTRLMPKGIILLEIEASLGRTALEAVRTAFPQAEPILHQDLAGRDRLIEIRK